MGFWFVPKIRNIIFINYVGTKNSIIAINSLKVKTNMKILEFFASMELKYILGENCTSLSPIFSEL